MNNTFKIYLVLKNKQLKFVTTKSANLHKKRRTLTEFNKIWEWTKCEI